jgi:hypothetical protein
MSTIAKKPRKNRQHKDKEDIKCYYARWKENGSLYKSKTGNESFLNDMTEKYTVSRNTLLKWMAEWKLLES